MKVMLDVTAFVPKQLEKLDLKVIPKDNKIEIVPVSNSLHKGRLPYSIELNRYIFSNEKFYEVMGMYFGDGLKSLSGSGDRQIFFANTEVALHSKWIDFLEGLGVHRSKLKYQIQIGEKNGAFDETKVKNYWVKNLNVPKENFNKINIKKKKRTKPNGVLVIAFYSKIFSQIFRNIYKYCLSELKARKKIVSFVRGLFAAEGSVKLNKNQIIHSLGISAGFHNKREEIRNLLKKIGIFSVNNSDRRDVQITGYFNFLKFHQLNLQTLHPKKQTKFDHAFKKMKTAPGLLKFLIINQLAEKELTRYHLAKILNRKLSAINYNLKDLEAKNIVKKHIVGKKGQSYECFWILNEFPNNLYTLTTQDYGKR